MPEMKKITDPEQLRISRESFHMGFVAGLRMYAWWNDGEQQVGSCGTTLKQAIERADKEYLNSMKELEA
jgi:hypothetical protein